MYRLEKMFRFEASHQLVNHDGKCSRLHGHSWVGYITVEGDHLVPDGPKQGMLVDYSDLSTAIKPFVEDFLDHHHLNHTLSMSDPTSERIAKMVYDMMKPNIPLLVAVRIEETCTSAAEYRPS